MKSVLSQIALTLLIVGTLHSVLADDPDDSDSYSKFTYTDSSSYNNDYPATYYEVKPQSEKYGVPPAPAPTYGTPAPAYGAPSPTYGTPKPEYGVPSSSYGVPKPKPSYGTPKAPKAEYGPPPKPTYTYDHTPLRGYGLDSESPFVQKRLFNTAVALTVPLFSFVLPQRSSVSGGMDLANQALFVGFALFVVVLTFAVPVLFTHPQTFAGRSSDRNGILNNLMANNKVLNFMGADLSNKVGLDTTSCLQKSICEAHRTPKKYGMLATPFQMLFPPPTEESESKASIFQMAAKLGQKAKEDCGSAYKCFFDIMDLCSYAIDWWKYSSDPNYMLEF